MLTKVKQKAKSNTTSVDLDVYVDEPPQPLGPVGRALWDRVLGDRDLSEQRERELLFQACTAVQRASDLGAEIERDGPVIESATGRKTEHPAIRPELHYRALATRCLALLKPQGPGSPGRPAGFRSWRDDGD